MAPNAAGPRLLALALVLAAVALVLLTGWDYQVRILAQSWRSFSPAQALATAAYWSGLGGTQVAVLTLLALWGWHRRQPRAIRAGISGIGAVVVSGILVQVVKHLAGRPRPRLALPPGEYFGPTFKTDLLSFPSGHATTSFAVAAALSVFYPRQAWLFYLLAALLSIGRVISDSHYFSDVLAGAILGLAVGWPLASLVARRGEARS